MLKPLPTASPENAFLSRNRAVSVASEEIDFGHDEDEVAHVTIDKIPTIAMELVPDVVDKAGWPIKFIVFSRPTNTLSRRSKPMK